MSVQQLQNDTEDAPENTVSDFVGLSVYTSVGMYVGRVTDTRLDFTGPEITGLVVQELNPDLHTAIPQTRTKDAIIPFRWIQATHDIVIVYDFFSHLENHTTE